MHCSKALKRVVFLLFVFVFIATIHTQSSFASNSTITSEIPTRPRRVFATSLIESTQPVIGDTAITEDVPEILTNSDFVLGQKDTLQDPLANRLQMAIDEKLGIPYRYHGQDSSGYDCSGFVWSVFKDVGVSFNRSSAAEYFYNFSEATPEEQSQFGTLVFFNGLSHIGIVKDENYFYHSSSRFGVMLSRFDKYWKARITGYRRIPNLQMAAQSKTQSTIDNF